MNDIVFAKHIADAFILPHRTSFVTCLGKKSGKERKKESRIDFFRPFLYSDSKKRSDRIMENRGGSL